MNAAAIHAIRKSCWCHHTLPSCLLWYAQTVSLSSLFLLLAFAFCEVCFHLPISNGKIEKEKQHEGTYWFFWFLMFILFNCKHARCKSQQELPFLIAKFTRVADLTEVPCCNPMVSRRSTILSHQAWGNKDENRGGNSIYQDQIHQNTSAVWYWSFEKITYICFIISSTRH